MENEDIESVTTTDEFIIDFESILERINNLEKVVLSLANPEFMYRRPGSEDYEKITDTLDYLHSKIRELENDSRIQ
jgi:hypothetical protein